METLDPGGLLRVCPILFTDILCGAVVVFMEMNRLARIRIVRHPTVIRTFPLPPFREGK
jgi:hypothetical protein